MGLERHAVAVFDAPLRLQRFIGERLKMQRQVFTVRQSQQRLAGVPRLRSLARRPLNDWSKSRAIASSTRADGRRCGAIKVARASAKRLCVGRAALRRVDRSGDRLALVDDLQRPVEQRNLTVAPLESQTPVRARAPPPSDAGCGTCARSPSFESGGLSLSKQCNGRDRWLTHGAGIDAERPNGSRSIKRTSTYSTPRSRSACSGRSPGRMTRFGRIVPYDSFSICSRLVVNCRYSPPGPRMP